MECAFTFGAADASALILNLQTKQSVDELSSAEIVLKLDPSFDEPIDLFSERLAGTGCGARRDME